MVINELIEFKFRTQLVLFHFKLMGLGKEESMTSTFIYE